MDEQERWRAIAGYEGLYEVSDLGRVRSLPREVRSRFRPTSAKGLVLAPRYNKQGYVAAMLQREGVCRSKLVHRLVCFAFLGLPPPDKHDVNHKNGIKSDNRLPNLEWTNDSLNVKHAYAHLGVVSKIGELKPWLGKLGADNPRSKPVVQILDSERERYFAGVMDAARQTGLSFRHISACCLGKRKRHGGYQWRFAESSNV